MMIDVSHLKAEARGAALEGIRAVLTEENTDRLIERLEALIKPKMPWWGKFIPIGMVLDKLLPDTLLRVFEDALGGGA